MTSKQEKPQILEPLEDATVYESETVVLNTQISGNPTPEVEWFKNDKPVTNLPIKVEGTLHTCILNSTTQTDTARYSVVATNLMGTAKTFCHLLVESKLIVLYVYESYLFNYYLTLTLFILSSFYVFRNSWPTSSVIC